jgi:hypothetical protein
MFTSKNAERTAIADDGSAKFGLPPVINKNVMRNMGRVYKRDFPKDFLVPEIFKSLTIY